MGYGLLLCTAVHWCLCILWLRSATSRPWQWVWTTQSSLDLRQQKSLSICSSYQTGIFLYIWPCYYQNTRNIFSITATNIAVHLIRCWTLEQPHLFLLLYCKSYNNYFEFNLLSSYPQSSSVLVRDYNCSYILYIINSFRQYFTYKVRRD